MTSKHNRCASVVEHPLLLLERTSLPNEFPVHPVSSLLLISSIHEILALPLPQSLTLSWGTFHLIAHWEKLTAGWCPHIPRRSSIHFLCTPTWSGNGVSNQVDSCRHWPPSPLGLSRTSVPQPCLPPYHLLNLFIYHQSLPLYWHNSISIQIFSTSSLKIKRLHHEVCRILVPWPGFGSMPSAVKA